MRTLPVILLTIQILISGAGWAIGTLVPLRYALIHHRFPMVGRITLLGGGPFDSLGIEGQILAGLVFVTISALRVLSAYWIWNLRLDGVILDVILMSLSAIFWWGFALPLGPIGAVIEIILIVLSWGKLA